METQSPRKKRRKRKMARTSPRGNDHHLFAQMLAAYANIHSPFSQSVLLKCLRKIHASLTQPQDSSIHEFDALVALLPPLLMINNPKVAASSGEIIGAAALLSYETNVRIAFSKEIVDSLVTALGSCSKQVVLAACNALLDLSTTTIGREKLQESSAVEKLLSVFCQMAAYSARIDFHCTLKKGIHNRSKVRLVEDKFIALVVDALSALINNCQLEFLEIIPEGLLITSLAHLKEIWAKVQYNTYSNPKISYLFSNIQVHDLAETIFRLSVNHDCTSCNSDAVQRSMFDSMFENFILKCWEDSPLLLREASEKFDGKEDIFSSLVHFFKSKTIDAVIVSVLEGLVSCPPIASDELDILNFLKDVKGRLGSTVLYGQDLRVVKTVELTAMPEQSHFKKELHLLKDGMDFGAVKSLELTKNDYVHKCKEAYHSGYSIALRGMEFRSENVSAIADGLELLFGQPSVGANLYLTPPKSQGLARHFDDHCVFVCQLVGKKQWAVFPRSTVQLPRLYEPSCIVLGSEDDNNRHEGEQFFLNEGDILYIPRGCPHEAFTLPNDGESQLDEKDQFSLHLTLGIEVEPPFEWEGFAHMALHCWKQNKYQKAHGPVDSSSTIPDASIVSLLHVAIRLIGDHDPTFRKACMVAAFSLPSNSRTEIPFHILDLNQRATFSYVIDRINADSSFLEAFRTVEAAVHGKNDELFQWMRWLRHLPHEEMDGNTAFENPLELFEELVLLHDDHTEEATAVFTSMKAQFCADVVFEDVCKIFEMLLKKYKKTRKQYRNGMLSLHYMK